LRSALVVLRTPRWLAVAQQLFQRLAIDAIAARIGRTADKPAVDKVAGSALSCAARDRVTCSALELNK
jgi:hypothetical protein